MKIVAIRDMSVTNGYVGEMWRETKVFDGSATLEEVALWAFPRDQHGVMYSGRNVVLTIPHEVRDE